MLELTSDSFDPASAYVCLDAAGGSSRIEVGPDFWLTVDQREDLKDGRLVAVFHSTEDWPSWEMHPHGEEVLVLLWGAMDMVFEKGSEQRIVELRERRACIVPRGTWHRAIVHAPSDLLAITFGKGTQQRPR